MKKNINSLYMHFPFCRHLCNYCDFYKKVPQELGEYSQFENMLSAMWHRHDQLLDQFNYSMNSIDTLYLGGGTPSLWGEKGARFLKEELSARDMTLSKEGEFTLEVNPGSWTKDGILTWREMGMNRFSLGIQALDSNYLKMLDRVHNIEDVHETLAFFNNHNLNFSVDFMLGLPRHYSMRPRNIKAELDEIFRYRPSHVSLYILTTKSHYVHRELLPDEDLIAQEYENVSQYFEGIGWHHYEVSNFAKPGFESKHNLNYWRCHNVAALGPSAVGYLADDHYRYKWKSQTPEFEPEKLTRDQVEMERLYMGLRISDGLKIDEVQDPRFSDLVDKWCESDLAMRKNERVILTSKGYLLIDMLMDQIFSL